MPNPATDKLARILKLEMQMGCQDRAVTKGLASFSGAWLADAARNAISPEWAEEVAQDMRSYSAMTETEARRAALAALIAKLQGAPTAPLPAGGAGGEFTPAPARAEASAPARETRPREERPPAPRPISQQPKPANTQYPIPNNLGLDAPITKITGIGDFNAARFEKLGVKTIRDLLYFFPARYDDYSALKTINQLEYGEQVTILAKVNSARKQKTKTGMYIIRVGIEDASGMMECSWFTSERFVDNMLRQFAIGREIVISGKVTEYLGRITFQNPTYEPAEKDWISGGNIVPVYRMTEGLQPLLVRRVMRRLVEYWPGRAPEFLPDGTRRELLLMPLADALREIHWPRNPNTQEAARRRLAFDELFVLQMAVLKQRQVWRGEPAQPLQVGEPTLDRLIAALPYALTGAQRRAIMQIFGDLKQPIAMHRLLQGDVGSGKTVVAALAMALAANIGAQSALMAPTEILAEQHFNNLKKLFDAFAAAKAIPKVELRLLTGSVKASEKRAIYDELASGAATIAIGTHALIQEGVNFANLGLVVVDEQHRFGVEQRKALREKGAAAENSRANPHTLVMTATPIPRTLALTMYGDLDNTVLDEMPPGRQPIETHWVSPPERERAYSFVRSEIAKGRQAFVICPLVEESDKVEAKAAVEEHARLQKEVFPQLKLGLLHGRMKPDDKEDVMRKFKDGEYHILVSTSVVEVGIDIPNASVMMIEGANRFGLSQLHQFRGRVGRGQFKSYCLLLADATSDVAEERLQAIVSTTDGFKLAEIDLKLRGPGEFFGTRQSGDPELKLVSIGDQDLLAMAREQAQRIFARDADLSAPEHKLLSDKVDAFWAARESRGDAS